MHSVQYLLKSSSDVFAEIEKRIFIWKHKEPHLKMFSWSTQHFLILKLNKVTAIKTIRMDKYQWNRNENPNIKLFHL